MPTYEISLQLVRPELTVIEAAEQWEAGRGFIVRIRTVAKQVALEALAQCGPRGGGRRHGTSS